jgi:hypothetical protein
MRYVSMLWLLHAMAVARSARRCISVLEGRVLAAIDTLGALQ